MLLAHSRDPVSSEERAFIDFFNATHSAEAWLGGVRLALWLTEPPPPQPEPGEVGVPLAALGWCGSGGADAVWLPVADVESNPTLLDKVSAVVLAHPEVASKAAGTWKRLLGMGYLPTLEGQVSGWFLEAGEEVEEAPPSYRYTGALLPAQGRSIFEDECLVLVEVNYRWCVLSEVGAGTYAHGRELTTGNEVFFRPDSKSGIEEIVVVGRSGVVEPGELGARFGPEVDPEHRDLSGVARTRSDTPALLVTVKRGP